MLKTRLDSVTRHDGRIVAYVQILDEADNVVATFDTYYDPAEAGAFRSYCDARIQAVQDSLDSARAEITSLLEES